MVLNIGNDISKQDDVQININPPVDVATNFIQNNDSNNIEDKSVQTLQLPNVPLWLKEARSEL